MAFVGGFALARVNADQFGPMAFGQIGVAPEVQVAGNRVAAPDQNQLGLGKKFDPHAGFGPQCVDQRLAAGRGTDGAVEQRRAELVKKPCRHAFALHQPHGAGVAVGQDGLRVAPGNVAEPGRDVGQRRIPAYRLKLARAFGADAFEWLQDALWVVSALGVARHLGTQRAIGVRVCRVAMYLDRHAVFHGRQQRAGVGAVMRAGALDLNRLRVGAGVAVGHGGQLMGERRGCKHIPSGRCCRAMAEVTDAPTPKRLT